MRQTLPAGRALLLTLLFGLLPFAVQAQDVFVYDGGSAGPIGCNNPDEATTSDGIYAASVGDEVFVCPGTYSENPTIAKDNLDSAEKGLRNAKKTGLWRLSGGKIARDHLFSVQPTLRFREKAKPTLNTRSGNDGITTNADGATVEAMTIQGPSDGYGITDVWESPWIMVASPSPGTQAVPGAVSAAIKYSRGATSSSVPTAVGTNCSSPPEETEE